MVDIKMVDVYPHFTMSSYWYFDKGWCLTESWFFFNIWLMFDKVLLFDIGLMFDHELIFDKTLLPVLDIWLMFDKVLIKSWCLIKGWIHTSIYSFNTQTGRSLIKGCCLTIHPIYWHPSMMVGGVFILPEIIAYNYVLINEPGDLLILYMALGNILKREGSRI